MNIDMKKYKLLLSISIIFVLISAMFFDSIPMGHAQTNQDWSNPVNLSLSGSATNPILVRDFRGTLHAIWVNTIDGYKYSQSADGNTWTTPQTVNFPFAASTLPPTLLADSYGSIHIFWIDSGGSLFYGRTTPEGFANPGTWRSLRLAQGVINFDVALDSRGGLRMAFIQNGTVSGISPGIYYLQSNVGGGSWSKVAMLYKSEYFRSATQDVSSIRVALSGGSDDKSIYVTWDIRPLKRVFMISSVDDGLNWTDAQQIKGPEDTEGLTPFNLNAAFFDGNILLMWELGEPGSEKCTVYSQWSEDGGKTWGETTAVLGGSSNCPRDLKFVARSQGYAIALLVGQVDSIMVAWNGKRWSQPQTQVQLPTFSNPLTLDVVMLGCRYDLFEEGHLYVVGCDQGNGGDIWFLSRPLNSVESWFSPLSTWTEPGILLSKLQPPEKVSAFSSASDDMGYIHAVWVQSTTGRVIPAVAKIEYARWDGRQWSKPTLVVSSSNGIPVQLSLNVDSQGRLLLTWVNSSTGDLTFTWAKSDKAILTSEWAGPRILPSPSRINTSPNLLADETGRIVVVYAVPINEDRGIYVVQSTDSGNSWSLPRLAFDAVSAGWEGVEQPKICLGADGILNLSFVRGTKRVGQPVGLYYSRSVDGGATWSDAQEISDDTVLWQKILCYSDQTVHMLWQGYDGLVFANLSRISQDSGETWGQPNSITGVSDNALQVTAAMRGHDLLHFIQVVEKSDTHLVNQKDVILQDVSWDGSSWNSKTEKTFTIIGDGIHYSLSADITSTGFLGVFLSVGYANPTNEMQDQVFVFHRFLRNDESVSQSAASIIPTSESNIGVPDALLPVPTPTLDLTVLNEDAVSTSSMQRNLIGVFIVGFGVIVATFILLKRRPIKRK